MTPMRKKEYIIMDKSTGHVIHEGSDRRSILPNQGDLRNQIILVVLGVVLTGFISAIGYCGDLAYKGITSSIADLKASQEAGISKIWNTMSVRKTNRDNQFSWILQECCADAKTSPPQMTAQ